RVHGSGTCNGRDLAGRIECEAAGAALGEKIGREREWRSAGTDGLGECVCDGGERRECGWRTRGDGTDEWSGRDCSSGGAVLYEIRAGSGRSGLAALFFDGQRDW